MSSTLRVIRVHTGSLEVLMCWVEEMLLIHIPENCGVVLDNAAFHQSKAIQKIIKDAGILYLPPYSPDLNPIEKQWARAKQIRRSTHCSINTRFSVTVL
ncbi:transposase [Holospora curviuscula]|uniref:Tc1-like transposase DDE domain-containing protein n=1 Tax=Holospora curviuscula TaxID=1082868 RepID=A0A2S5R7D1_9PROT|nr:transposase [Holospora curviuscula]PPE03228.1 hypothetical protein HCUR_01335 [Holospora curviuscula]